MEEEIKKPSRVFFLGAGASFVDGVPLQSQLLKKCFELIDKDSFEYTQIKEFFEVFFNLKEPITGNDFPKMEQLLGMLEMPKLIDIDYPGYSEKRINEFKRIIFGVILKALRKCSSDIKKSYNYRFVKKIKDNLDDFDEINFITMNYDTVLDDSLSLLNTLEKIDFGLDLVNYYSRYNKKFPLEKPMPGNIHLLKLHGSISYRYCRVCQSIELVHTDGDDIFDQSFCSIDGTPTEILVVPPSFFKNLKVPPLMQLWIKARLMLMDADEIYFIGYSLPLADIPVWQMLKSAELARPNKKVIVVDAKGKKSGEINKRYSQIFTNIEYLPIGFESFIDSIEKYLM